MKKIFFFLVIVCFAISCKNENAISESGNYLLEPVGINDSGKFKITNLANIRQYWQADASTNDAECVLEDFAIVKGITTGDRHEDYYILLARDTKNVSRTAAMLTLKGNKFYFNEQQGPESVVYLKIVCSGDCNQGCNPIVQVSGNTKFLVCSPCIDCIKTEKEMR